MKSALITGISGQDGSYLAEFLLDQGYQVHGTVRRVALEDPERRLWRLQGLLDRVTLHAASLEALPSLYRVVAEVRPAECYHLAAPSFVSYSFEDETSSVTTSIAGTTFLLSALRELAPECRFYFAGSSEMFGNPLESPQSEGTPFRPRSPYGVSKVAGAHLTRAYREAHGLFGIVGILFNHESERRGFEFVTRKISSTVAKIKLGWGGKLVLGNLQARRDWGYAPEYVRAMWMMLQQESPTDYVIASGASHSVEEFVAKAFQVVGLAPEAYVETEARLYRPTEINELRGDASRARRELGWSPTVSFERIVERMVEADLRRLSDARRPNGVV
jgi:GDPmannose 4,6-dehydratase